jgi:hypothetical protein
MHAHTAATLCLHPALHCASFATALQRGPLETARSAFSACTASCLKALSRRTEKASMPSSFTCTSLRPQGAVTLRHADASSMCPPFPPCQVANGVLHPARLAPAGCLWAVHAHGQYLHQPLRPVMQLARAWGSTPGAGPGPAAQLRHP